MAAEIHKRSYCSRKIFRNPRPQHAALRKSSDYSGELLKNHGPLHKAPSRQRGPQPQAAREAPKPPRRPVRKALGQDLAESPLSANKTTAFPLKTAPEPLRRPVRKAPDQDFAESSLSASKTTAFPLETTPEPLRRPVRKAPEQDLAESFLPASKTAAFLL